MQLVGRNYYKLLFKIVCLYRSYRSNFDFEDAYGQRDGDQLCMVQTDRKRLKRTGNENNLRAVQKWRRAAHHCGNIDNWESHTTNIMFWDVSTQLCALSVTYVYGRLHVASYCCDIHILLNDIN